MPAHAGQSKTNWRRRRASRRVDARRRSPNRGAKPPRLTNGNRFQPLNQPPGVSLRLSPAAKPPLALGRLNELVSSVPLDGGIKIAAETLCEVALKRMGQHTR